MIARTVGRLETANHHFPVRAPLLHRRTETVATIAILRRTAAYVAILSFALGCSVPPDRSVESPDGSRTASVRNHWTIDPPSQSLWLTTKAGASTRVATLTADVDWCDEIVWSADGTTAAYLIQDAKLLVVNAEDAHIVTTEWLVPRDGYPTQYVATDVRLSMDGATATYRPCHRADGRCLKPRRVTLRTTDA